jgi:hypothetical protein
MLLASSRARLSGGSDKLKREAKPAIGAVETVRIVALPGFTSKSS